MLFKQAHLEGIRSGTIGLAFRKWKKPAVKSGSLVKTSVGLIQIVDITTVTLDSIRPAEARQAGFNSLKELQSMLSSVTEGDIYKITVRYHSEDPRISLREQAQLPPAAFETLRSKLQRLDQYSKQGEWTINTLMLIRDHPQLRAADLAAKSGHEKEWLKINIRKLKNLGLTVSHDTGYTLSPLGKVFLEKLNKQE